MKQTSPIPQDYKNVGPMLGSGRNYGTGTTNQGPSGIETASMDPVSINFKSTEARTRMQRVS